MQIKWCFFLHRDVEAAERVLRRGNSEGFQRMLVVAGTLEQDKGQEREGRREEDRGMGVGGGERGIKDRFLSEWAHGG